MYFYCDNKGSRLIKKISSRPKANVDNLILKILDDKGECIENALSYKGSLTAN